MKIGTDKRYTYVQDTLPHSLLAVYQGATVGVSERIVPSERLAARMTAGVLRIEGDGILGTVAISDAQGRQILSREVLDRSVEFDRKTLPRGVLLVRSWTRGTTIRIVNGN